jgi:hypothetical protein
MYIKTLTDKGFTLGAGGGFSTSGGGSFGGFESASSNLVEEDRTGNA